MKTASYVALMRTRQIHTTTKTCLFMWFFFSVAGSGKCHLNNLSCTSTGPTRCKSFRGKMFSLNCFTFNILFFFVDLDIGN